MRSSRLFALLALLGLLFAGCGDSSSDSGAANGVAALTADEILTRAAEAAKAQTSVHMVGKGNDDGTPIELDLRLSKEKGASGKISIDGGVLQLVSDRTTLYVKANASFWTEQANAASAQLIGDRWVSMGADTQGFGDIADFDSALTGLLEPEGTITKGETAKIAGRDAIALVSSEGKLWIATTGEPLPLRIDSEDGALDFKDWGKSFDIKPPAAKDVVDMSKLGG